MRDIERIVGTVFEQIGSALAHGYRVELRGFGAFSTPGCGERVGHSPLTGDEQAVPSKVVPHFKPGKVVPVYRRTSGHRSITRSSWTNRSPSRRIVTWMSHNPIMGSSNPAR